MRGIQPSNPLHANNEYQNFHSDEFVTLVNALIKCLTKSLLWSHPFCAKCTVQILSLMLVLYQLNMHKVLINALCILS